METEQEKEDEEGKESKEGEGIRRKGRRGRRGRRRGPPKTTITKFSVPCEYSHHSQFQATNVKSLRTQIGRDVHSQLL